MAKVTFYYNAKMREHTHEWPHVEKNTRVSHAFDHLTELGLIASCDVRPGRLATDKELCTVHTPGHIAEIKEKTCAAKADPTNRELREPDGPGEIISGILSETDWLEVRLAHNTHSCFEAPPAQNAHVPWPRMDSPMTKPSLDCRLASLRLAWM